MSKQPKRIASLGPRHESRVFSGAQPRIGNIAIAQHSHMKQFLRKPGHDFLYRKILRVGVARAGIRRCEDGDGTRLGASHFNESRWLGT